MPLRQQGNTETSWKKSRHVRTANFSLPYRCACRYFYISLQLPRATYYTIKMTQITREEALRRWHNALRTKREMTERMVAELVEDYEKEHGEKPQSVEIW